MLYTGVVKHMGQQVQVTLYRDSLSTPWGFRLYGGVDYGLPLSVKKVTPVSSAEGELHIGDIVLSVDGHDVTQATHQFATDLILNAGGCIKITVLRNSTSTQAQTSTFSAASSSSQSTKLMSPNDDDEVEIPQNKQLAGLMKHAVSVQQQGKLNQLKIHASNQGYKTLPLFRTSASRNEPKPDITSYLPKPPPRGKSFTPSRTMTPTYAEREMRNYVRNSLLTSPTGSNDSGRSSPISVLEMAGSGTPAVGVWTPPAHDPNKRLVHMQYNSPMNLYTPHNVANMVQMQTGQKLQWLQKPRVRFLDDISDSPTYQYIHENDEQGPSRGQRATSVDYPQSSTFNHLTNYFRKSGMDA